MAVQVQECSSGRAGAIDRTRHQELCQQIRRLIQDHSLELANGGQIRQDALDEALRNVWVLEQLALGS